jgi:hypothetical protein
MNCGLEDKTCCRFTFPQGNRLKPIPNLAFSPFQWTSDVSPQFIRGRDVEKGARSELMKNNFLSLVNTIVEQDVDILSKLYADTPQKIRLNNEVGMDWVRRNFQNFPHIGEPNLSQR